VPLFKIEPATAEALAAQVAKLEKDHDIIQVFEHGSAWLIVAKRRAKMESRG